MHGLPSVSPSATPTTPGRETILCAFLSRTLRIVSFGIRGLANRLALDRSYRARPAGGWASCGDTAVAGRRLVVYGVTFRRWQRRSTAERCLSDSRWP